MASPWRARNGIRRACTARWRQNGVCNASLSPLMRSSNHRLTETRRMYRQNAAGSDLTFVGLHLRLWLLLLFVDYRRRE